MDFHGMKRKELQALCKKHSVPANLSNCEMAYRLASIFKDKEKPISQVEFLEENSVEIASENGAKFVQNARKVTFSPENETFIFEKSDKESDEEYTPVKKRRGRRQSIADPVSKKQVQVVENGPSVGLPAKTVAIRTMTRSSVQKGFKGDVNNVLSPVGKKRTRRSTKVEIIDQKIVDVSDKDLPVVELGGGVVIGKRGGKVSQRQLRSKGMGVEKHPEEGAGDFGVSKENVTRRASKKRVNAKGSDRLVSLDKSTKDVVSAGVVTKSERITTRSKQNVTKDKDFAALGKELGSTINVGRNTRFQARLKGTTSEVESEDISAEVQQDNEAVVLQLKEPSMRLTKNELRRKSALPQKGTVEKDVLDGQGIEPAMVLRKSKRNKTNSQDSELTRRSTAVLSSVVPSVGRAEQCTKACPTIDASMTEKRPRRSKRVAAGQNSTESFNEPCEKGRKSKRMPEPIPSEETSSTESAPVIEKLKRRSTRVASKSDLVAPKGPTGKVFNKKQRSMSKIEATIERTQFSEGILDLEDPQILIEETSVTESESLVEKPTRRSTRIASTRDSVAPVGATVKAIQNKQCGRPTMQVIVDEATSPEDQQTEEATLHLPIAAGNSEISDSNRRKEVFESSKTQSKKTKEKSSAKKLLSSAKELTTHSEIEEVVSITASSARSPFDREQKLNFATETVVENEDSNLIDQEQVGSQDRVSDVVSSKVTSPINGFLSARQLNHEGEPSDLLDLEKGSKTEKPSTSNVKNSGSDNLDGHSTENDKPSIQSDQSFEPSEDAPVFARTGIVVHLDEVSESICLGRNHEDLPGETKESNAFDHSISEEAAQPQNLVKNTETIMASSESHLVTVKTDAEGIAELQFSSSRHNAQMAIPFTPSPESQETNQPEAQQIALSNQQGRSCTNHDVEHFIIDTESLDETTSRSDSFISNECNHKFTMENTEDETTKEYKHEEALHFDSEPTTVEGCDFHSFNKTDGSVVEEKEKFAAQENFVGDSEASREKCIHEVSVGDEFHPSIHEDKDIDIENAVLHTSSKVDKCMSSKCTPSKDGDEYNQEEDEVSSLVNFKNSLEESDALLNKSTLPIASNVVAAEEEKVKTRDSKFEGATGVLKGNTQPATLTQISSEKLLEVEGETAHATEISDKVSCESNFENVIVENGGVTVSSANTGDNAILLENVTVLDGLDLALKKLYEQVSPTKDVAGGRSEKVESDVKQRDNELEEILQNSGKGMPSQVIGDVDRSLTPAICKLSGNYDAMVEMAVTAAECTERSNILEEGESKNASGSAERSNILKVEESRTEIEDYDANESQGKDTEVDCNHLQWRMETRNDARGNETICKDRDLISLFQEEEGPFYNAFNGSSADTAAVYHQECAREKLDGYEVANHEARVMHGTDLLALNQQICDSESKSHALEDDGKIVNCGGTSEVGNIDIVSPLKPEMVVDCSVDNEQLDMDPLFLEEKEVAIRKNAGLLKDYKHLDDARGGFRIENNVFDFQEAAKEQVDHRHAEGCMDLALKKLYEQEASSTKDIAGDRSMKEELDVEQCENVIKEVHYSACNRVPRQMIGDVDRSLTESVGKSNENCEGSVEKAVNASQYIERSDVLKVEERKTENNDFGTNQSEGKDKEDEYNRLSCRLEVGNDARVEETTDKDRGNDPIGLISLFKEDEGLYDDTFDASSADISIVYYQESGTGACKDANEEASVMHGTDLLSVDQLMCGSEGKSRAPEDEALQKLDGKAVISVGTAELGNIDVVSALEPEMAVDCNADNDPTDNDSLFQDEEVTLRKSVGALNDNSSIDDARGGFNVENNVADFQEAVKQQVQGHKDATHEVSVKDSMDLLPQDRLIRGSESKSSALETEEAVGFHKLDEKVVVAGAGDTRKATDFEILDCVFSPKPNKVADCAAVSPAISMEKNGLDYLAESHLFTTVEMNLFMGDIEQDEALKSDAEERIENVTIDEHVAEGQFCEHEQQVEEEFAKLECSHLTVQEMASQETAEGSKEQDDMFTVFKGSTSCKNDRDEPVLVHNLQVSSDVILSENAEGSDNDSGKFIACDSKNLHEDNMISASIDGLEFSVQEENSEDIKDAIKSSNDQAKPDKHVREAIENVTIDEQVAEVKFCEHERQMAEDFAELEGSQLTVQDKASWETDEDSKEQDDMSAIFKRSSSRNSDRDEPVLVHSLQVSSDVILSENARSSGNDPGKFIAGCDSKNLEEDSMVSASIDGLEFSVEEKNSEDIEEAIKSSPEPDTRMVNHPPAIGNSAVGRGIAAKDPPRPSLRKKTPLATKGSSILFTKQFSSSALKIKTNKTNLIQGTSKQGLAHNMKENAPSSKGEQLGYITAPRALSKRRPLEDLRKN